MAKSKIIICICVFLTSLSATAADTGTDAAGPDLFEQLRASQNKNLSKKQKTTTQQEVPGLPSIRSSAEKTDEIKSNRSQEVLSPFSARLPAENDRDKITPALADTEIASDKTVMSSTPSQPPKPSTAAKAAKAAKADKITETVKISGRIQFDFRRHQPAITDEEAPLKNTIFSIRRGRLEFEGAISHAISYEISFELSDSVKTKNAYINLEQSDDINYRVGQFKYPFGSENINSSRYYEFLETAMLSNTLSSSRDRGLMLRGNLVKNKLLYSAGVVSGTGTKTPAQNSGMDYFAHTDALVFDDEGWQMSLWFGVSFSRGKQQSSNKNTLEIFPETESGFTLFAADLPNDTSYIRQRYAVDAKMVYGSIFLGLEYLNADYTYTTKASIKGGYVMASYFLTGEQRVIKKGLLGQQKISHPFSSADGWGAWEIAVRYSKFVISNNFFEADGLFAGWASIDDTKNARQGNAFTLGLNWYPSKQTRMLLNWVQTTANKFDDVAGAYVALKTEKALLLRGQIEF